jgi:hypothetical protein
MMAQASAVVQPQFLGGFDVVRCRIPAVTIHRLVTDFNLDAALEQCSTMLVVAAPRKTAFNSRLDVYEQSGFVPAGTSSKFVSAVIGESGLDHPESPCHLPCASSAGHDLMGNIAILLEVPTAFAPVACGRACPAEQTLPESPE